VGEVERELRQVMPLVLGLWGGTSLHRGLTDLPYGSIDVTYTLYCYYV